MAIATEYPTSFRNALELTKKILSNNHDLVKKDLIHAEAELIVTRCYEKATGKDVSRMDLFSRMDDRYPDEASKLLIEVSHGRSEGKILQYLLGVQSFLDHDYIVNESVLVPRPETENLVMEVSNIIITEQGRLEGLEIGLGSGAISIELLSRFAQLKMWGTELSKGAIEVAKKNAEMILGTESKRLKPLQVVKDTDVFIAVGEKQFDFIVSNPPYLEESDPIETDVMSYEPKEALIAPLHPNYFYDRIALYAHKHLNEGGFIAVEIPEQRVNEVEKLFRDKDYETEIKQDLAGLDRIIIARQKHG